MQNQTPTGPRDWNKLVKESNGQLQFLPDALKEQATQWYKNRTEFFTKANEIAKLEATLNVEFNQLVQAIRLEMEKRGMADIWTLDLGFNLEALQEGQYIVQFTENKNLR